MESGSSPKTKSKKTTKRKAPKNDHQDGQLTQENDWQDIEEGESDIPPNNTLNSDEKIIIDEKPNESFKLQMPHINLLRAIADEVSLEGLSGITLEELWIRLSTLLQMPQPISTVLKNYAWDYLRNSKYMEFYKLPKARKNSIMQNVDDSEETYIYNPIKQNSVVVGSAIDYSIRQNVSDIVRNLTLDQVESQYSSHLIITADRNLRLKFIKNPISDPLYELNAIQFCLLEQIARGRYVGETTISKSLQKICKDPKMLFYHRKHLAKQHLITKQQVMFRSSSLQNFTGNILHLQRFYNEKKSKFQLMTEKIVDTLRTKPNYQTQYSEIKSMFNSSNQQNELRKLNMLAEFQKFIKTEFVKYREVYPEATEEEWKFKANDNEKKIRLISLRDPLLNVSGVWNDEEQKDESSDEESTGSTIYNNSITQQIYKIIKRSGESGRSIKEILSECDLDFYTVRIAVRKLVKTNLVLAIKIDIGRQRIMKYTVGYSDNSTNIIKQDSNEKETLEKESIDFLSNLLNISPEVLQSPCENSSNQNLTSKEDVCNEIKEPFTACKVQEAEEAFNFNSFEQSTCNYDHLLLKLRQHSVTYDEEEIFKEEVCPLKLHVEDDLSFEKLSSRAFEIAQLILACYNREIQFPKTELLESSDVLAAEHSADDQKNVPTAERGLKRKLEETSGEAKKMKLVKKYEPTATFMGPNPTVIFETVTVDDIEIKIFISSKPEEFSEAYAKFTYDLTLSVATLERSNFILELVRDEKLIVDIHRIYKLLVDYEKEKGITTLVDRKSIHRIYVRLIKDGYIKILQVFLSQGNVKRNAYVAVDCSLDLNATFFDSVVEQLKAKFFMRKIPQTLPISNEPPTVFDTSQITSGVGELNTLSSNDSPYKVDRRIGKVYGYLPKFMKLRVLHEFLFYLIYDYPLERLEIVNVKKLLEANEIVADETLLNDMPPIYNCEIGWKMFIPPLQEHIGWSKGWAIVCDLILRLPLSLFLKIVNVSCVIPELPDYLNHPIKQHYLIKYLPTEIRNGLLQARKYLHYFHESLTRLCFVGLLQFGPQKLREKDQLFVYVNRKTILLDTTTNTGGYHYIEEKEYKKLAYNFNTLSDVEDYWKELWNICINSNLGLRNCVAGTTITIDQADAKPILKESLQPQTQESVVERDDGRIPGDGRGAAGLDSALWPHLKRSWVTKGSDATEDPDTYLSKTSNVKKNSSSQQGSSSTSNQAARSNKQETIIRLKKGKRIIRKVISRKDKKIVRVKSDPLDRKLMENLKLSRVQFDEDEDRYLTICKIISKFLQPYNRKDQNVPYLIMRDVLHTLSPVSCNKTSSACHRRLGVLFGPKQEEIINQIVQVINYIPFIRKYFCSLLSNKKTVPERQLYSIFTIIVLHFAKSKKEIDHFLQVLSNNDPFLLNAFKLECLKHEQSLASNKSKSSNVSQILTYNSIDAPTKIKADNFYSVIKDHPKTETDIMLDTIRSIIHSSIGCKSDEINWVHQLFRVYQNYPNDLLRYAIDDVLATQMFSLKRSNLKRQHAENLPIAMKTLQFSFYYGFMQITNFPSELFLEGHQFFLGVLKHKSQLTDFSSNGLAMECFEQGHVVGLAEVSVFVNPYFNVDIPKEALILNPNIADHTELIKELATRYKKMLMAVKQGTFFNDEDNNESLQQTDETPDVVPDTTEPVAQEKIKTTGRIPMVQRFLKSWFLIDESEVTEDDGEPSTTQIIEDLFKKPKSDIDKKPNEKRRKRFPPFMSNKESKKILESLYTENSESKSTENVQATSESSGLSFEDYEKKLENLLDDRDTAIAITCTKQKETVNRGDSNILQEFFTNRRAALKVDTVQENLNTVEIKTTKHSSKEILNQIPDKISEVVDPVMSDKIQYLLSDDLTVEQIMEEMLKECPSEERKIPKPTNLARLLVKGVFPEMDDDEEKLERLQKHFLVVCPDSSFLLSDSDKCESLKKYNDQQSEACNKLLKKLETECVISSSVPTFEEVSCRFKAVGATELDLKTVEKLIEFVLSKKAIGVSSKELKEQNFKFEKINLLSVIQGLIDLNVLIRVGVTFLVFVHHKHKKPWLVQTYTLEEQDKQKLDTTSTEEFSTLNPLSSLASYTEIKLQIRPWTRIDGTLNLKMFEKWLCTVLGYCLAGVKTPFNEIAHSCCYLKPVDVYYLIECLKMLGCIQMVTYKEWRTDLFSSFEYLEEVPATIIDAFENIYIEPENLAVIRLGAFLNKDLTAFDFPSDEAKKHGTI